MLKIEGATCTPVTAPTQAPAPVMPATAQSPGPSPRVSNQVNPLLGSTRPLGATRLSVGAAGLQGLLIHGGGV